MEKSRSMEYQKRPDGYHDTGPWAYKERTLKDYRFMIFKDAFPGRYEWLTTKPEYMTPDNPEQWSTRHYHSLKHYTPDSGAVITDQKVEHEWDWPEKNVFGGEAEFFQSGSHILDLGSGHGQVVQEINQKYLGKNIKCVGVDFRYGQDRPAQTANLSGGDIRNLPFKADSFDRVLSVESFPAWLPSDLESIKKYFFEITQVCQQGAIWRGTLPTYDEGEERETETLDELIKEFCQNGWEVVIQGNKSFMARLVQKNNT